MEFNVIAKCSVHSIGYCELQLHSDSQIYNKIKVNALQRLFINFYLPFIDRSGDNIIIKDGCESLFIDANNIEDFVSGKIVVITHLEEDLMSADSTSIGGIYQTPNFKSLKVLFQEIHRALKILQLDF